MATPPTRVSYNTPSSGNFSSNTTPKTTNTFDVVNGDLIVVVESIEDGASPSTVTPSASGGSVAWDPIRVDVSLGTGRSSARLWTGTVGATATGITTSLARPTTSTSLWWGMSATVWRNHGGVGAVFSGNNGTGSGAPSVSATCSANSAVQSQINDWTAADGTLPSPGRTWRTINGSPQTEALYFRDPVHHAAYGGYSPDTGAAGSITQGLTLPSTMRWVLAGIEILGTTGAAPYPFELLTQTPRGY